jgi:hypothetical protein
MAAWLRLALVCAPACTALVAVERALAWYVASAALVVSLLWEIQRGKHISERIACWVGMALYSAAAVYGLASESGAVSATGIWILLALIAIGAEGIHQWGVQSWPRR